MFGNTIQVGQPQGVLFICILFGSLEGLLRVSLNCSHTRALNLFFLLTKTNLPVFNDLAAFVHKCRITANLVRIHM